MRHKYHWLRPAPILGASLIALLVIAAFGCTPATGGRKLPSTTPGRTALPQLDAKQATFGRTVYAGTCATCHGERAQGHPDFGKTSDGPYGLYPPPPHDASGHTWHHGDGTLFRIIREGGKSYEIQGFESKMPAFGDSLSDEDIKAVISYFKSLWGEKERSFQAEVTQKDPYP